MNNNKIYKIDVRVDNHIYSMYNELADYHNINKTKLIERMMIEMYNKYIKGNDVSPDVRKDSLVHMCKIVNYANGIEDDYIRKNILEEAEKTCQLLK